MTARPRVWREPAAGPPGAGHRHGAVLCPGCGWAIQVVSPGPRLAEEFSVQCIQCFDRSFHRKTDMASSAVQHAAPARK